MKIIKLSVSNVKRLVAVEITPSGHLVVIGGRNGAGKSSVLDSIMFALGGQKAIQEEPIRRGAGKASVRVDLGDIVVERTWTAKGGSTVKVANAAGEMQKSPQSLLDELCGRIAFDPLAYSRMPPAEQAQLLRDLAGIDTAALDWERQEAYEQRTAAGRDVKRLSAQVAGMFEHASAPEAEVSVADLAAALQALQGQVRTNDRAKDEAQQAQQRADAAAAEAERLEREWAAAKQSALAAQQRAQTLTAAVGLLVDPDVAGVQQQLRTAESTNRAVRENADRRRIKADLDAATESATALTATISGIDEKKVQLLAEAQMPLPGLGFDAAGVTLNGLPLAQASQAEQLRLSVAMGLAMNPTLRVLLVRDGSLLDEDGLRMMAEMATDADAQVWLERVGAGAECQVVIEEGEVAP